MFKIFVDSDSDFTPAHCRKYDLGMVPMPYFWEGKSIRPFIDFGEDFDYHGFYEVLRSGVVPATSAVNPVEYIEYFEPAFKEGKDVLYISFSHALSSTFNALRLAEEELKEKYPDRTITVLDTKGITGCAYQVGIETIEYIQSGDHTLEEIKAFFEDTVKHTACYLYADNLKFFAKSGRVSGFAALMGGIIGIKPIIYLDDEGKMVTFEKARGRQNAMNRMLQIVDDLNDDIYNHRVTITHTDFPEGAEIVKQRLLEKYGDKLRLEVMCVNPTNGCHAGPDCVSITFHAKHR